jgi:cell division control protein 42
MIVLSRREPFTLMLFDTASDPEYESLRPLTYPGTDIFLICFSLPDRQAWNAVREKWVPEIEHHLPDTPFLLVGTKMDLRTDDRLEMLRFDEGEMLAKEMRGEKYCECSALTGEGVKAVFDQVTSRGRGVDGRRL